MLEHIVRILLMDGNNARGHDLSRLQYHGVTLILHLNEL